MCCSGSKKTTLSSCLGRVRFNFGMNGNFFGLTPRLNFLVKKSSFLYSKKMRNIKSVTFINSFFYKPLLTRLLVLKKKKKDFSGVNNLEFLIYNDSYLRFKRFYYKVFVKLYNRVRNRLYKFRFNRFKKVLNRRNTIYKKFKKIF